MTFYWIPVVKGFQVTSVTKKVVFYEQEPPIPVDTRRRFNVYEGSRGVYEASATSYRRLIDAETTSCVYWDRLLKSEVSGITSWIPLLRPAQTNNDSNKLLLQTRSNEANKQTYEPNEKL